MSEDPQLAFYQMRARASKLQYIEQCQFFLSYIAHIGMSETNEMSVAEFNNLYNILLNQKQYEKDQYEEAQRKAMANKK